MTPFQSISYFYLLIAIGFYDLKDLDFWLAMQHFLKSMLFNLTFLTQVVLVFSNPKTTNTAVTSFK